MSTSIDREYRRDPGEGWVTFAGFMIAIVGVLNIIYGIAAISNSRFYARDTTYIVHNLNVYGWVTLIIGAVQLAAAFGIFSHATWARWVGILTAAVNAIVQITWIAVYPFSAIAVLAIDVLVIYGLVMHGHKRASL